MVLRALRHRDYRLFWFGSFVSNVGLWMQQIALGWLVYQLTNKPSWLGIVGFVANLPMLALGLLGGAFADRAGRRTIMLGAQLVLAANALALAALTYLGQIAVWHILIVAAISGTASALYTPAVHAVVPSLVGPADLLNAISLNAVQFNLARTIGPVLAGHLYGAAGPTSCFLANAAGFLVLTLFLFRMEIPTRPAAIGAPSMARALRDGLRYARTHPVIWPALLLTGVMSVFGFPYIILMPAVARDTLHLDASGLGQLMTAVGAGAVLGGLGLSLAGELPRRGLVATLCALGFGVCLSSFAVVPTAFGTGALFFLLGVLGTACVATLNTTIQAAVEDGMRGRIMSMVTVLLFGFGTIGSLVLGMLGDHIGVPRALSLGGGVIVVAAVAALTRAEHLLAAHPAASSVA